jgi:hypothetical protein
MTGNRPESQQLLLLTEHTLDGGAVLPTIPRLARDRVHSINEEMHVRVLAIAMRHDDRFVLGESEPSEHTIRNALHRGAIDGVIGIEGDREMIHWLLNG